MTVSELEKELKKIKNKNLSVLLVDNMSIITSNLSITPVRINNIDRVDEVETDEMSAVLFMYNCMAYPTNKRKKRIAKK